MNKSAEAPAMRALVSMSDATRDSIRGVLTDIDDTLSTRGRVESVTFAAMERLRANGKRVIPVTGRPAGWCDHIARMWPVDAVVGENGAFYMHYDAETHRLARRFVLSDEERAVNRVLLAEVGERIVREIPGCAFASDQHYRESDLAIDYREDVPPLARAKVDRIVAMMEQEGMTARVSSIHVNGWFGDYNKLATTRMLLAEVFAIDLGAEAERWVFSGDSPNDAPMFSFFPNAVGVANVHAFADRIATLPAYVTQHESGAGFVELADFLLATTASRR